MKKKTSIICTFAFILTIVVGITACDTSNRVTGENIMGTETTGGNKLKSAYSSMQVVEPSSAEFTLEASSSSSNVDLDAINSTTTEHLVFDVVSDNQMDITGTLQVSTAFESPSSDLQKVNPVYRAYENTPQSISYNGYSSLSYTINGTSHSTSLNSQQLSMMNMLEQEMNEANSYGVGPSDPCLQEDVIMPERCLEQNTISSEVNSVNSIEAMTDKEIKKWLKEKGYKVKKLGNRRFQLTYKYKNKPLAISITSIFNAKTGRIEPGFITSQNGKKISTHLSKKKNGKYLGKSKMKRSVGEDKSEYLLFKITRGNNNY